MVAFDRLVSRGTSFDDDDDEKAASFGIVFSPAVAQATLIVSGVKLEFFLILFLTVPVSRALGFLSSNDGSSLVDETDDWRRRSLQSFSSCALFDNRRFLCGDGNRCGDTTEIGLCCSDLVSPLSSPVRIIES